jgi:hypothetical protein
MKTIICAAILSLSSFMGISNSGIQFPQNLPDSQVGSEVSISHERHEEIGFALCVGAFSSLMASLIYLIILSCLRPKLKISKDIANYDGRYFIKVINRSFGKVYDINVELLKMIPVNTTGGQNLRFSRIDLRNSKIWYMTGFRGKSEHATYAVLFSTEEDLSAIWTNNNEILHFKIIAKHAFSGFVKVKTQVYHCNTCIKKGSFEFGNSLKIL